MSAEARPADDAETRPAIQFDLASYNNQDYRPGGSRFARCLWYAVSLFIFESGIFPFSSLKRFLLIWFGAEIGRGLVIKPHVRIKYPWRLKIGDHCWLGQGVWIDNLGDVRLGNNVCLSQEAYLCSGSHDFRKPTFDLIVDSIELKDNVWVAARSLVLGGVTVGPGSVVGAGSVVTKDVPPGSLAVGVPARATRLSETCPA